MFSDLRSALHEALKLKSEHAGLPRRKRDGPEFDDWTSSLPSTDQGPTRMVEIHAGRPPAEVDPSVPARPFSSTNSMSLKIIGPQACQRPILPSSGMEGKSPKATTVLLTVTLTCLSQQLI